MIQSNVLYDAVKESRDITGGINHWLNLLPYQKNFLDSVAPLIGAAGKLGASLNAAGTSFKLAKDTLRLPVDICHSGSLTPSANKVNDKAAQRDGGTDALAFAVAAMKKEVNIPLENVDYDAATKFFLGEMK